MSITLAGIPATSAPIAIGTLKATSSAALWRRRDPTGIRGTCRTYDAEECFHRSSPEITKKTTTMALLNEYAHSQSLGGGTVSAWSHDWNPGHAVEFSMSTRAAPYLIDKYRG